MLTSLRVRNFRLFRDLQVEGLGRINLIGGRNGAGKTSLLEAIYLLALVGSPQAVIKIGAARGVPVIEGQDRPLLNTFWQPLFLGLDLGRAVRIDAQDDDAGRRRIEMCVAPANSAEQEVNAVRAQLRSDRPTDRDRATGLAVPITDGRETVVTSWRQPDQQGEAGRIELRGRDVEHSGRALRTPSVAFVSARNGNPAEDVHLLARLRKKKQSDLLLRALRILEPRFQAVEENSASGVPVLVGDIGLDELLPLSQMGEGLTRVARLILAVAEAQDSLVLVDEFENGIHHSLLEDVWSAVEEAARTYGAQVFATTHSYECLRAASRSLGGNLRYHRLERAEGEGEKFRCVTLDHSEIATSIGNGFEIR